MALLGVPEDSVHLGVPERLPVVAVDRVLLERAVGPTVTVGLRRAVGTPPPAPGPAPGATT